MSGLLLALALAQTPPACVQHLNDGLAEYQRKEFNKALIAFRTAAQCDPRFIQAHLAVANMYAERGNEGEALAALLQVLQLDPNNSLALRAASNLYLKNSMHGKAQPLLETLTAVDPKSAEAHADLAAVHAASGKREAAEKSFRRALELQPDFFPALAGLGNVLARAGEDAEALPLLRKAVQLQPMAYEGHFLLGCAFNRLGQFAEARAELEIARQIGGENEPQVFYQLARSWGGLGNASKRKAALSRFSELTKKQKDDAEAQRRAAAWIDEARKLIEAGDLETAVARLELAREVKQGDPVLLFRLAGLHYDMQHYDAAHEYAQAAISISPAVWLYHYLLGLVEQSAGRWADARTSLELAAKLQPAEAPVFNALGEVLREQGEQAGALAAFEKAVSLAPGNAAFRKNRDAARLTQ